MMSVFGRARALIDAGLNIVIFGEAGTGKTHLLRQIEEHYGPRCVVCATTGIAASNICETGQTLHSYLGIPVDKSLTAQMMINSLRKKRDVWMAVDTILIIDECSMLSAELFDILDEVGRSIRENSDRIFGGLQLVISADFFQLPPVEGGYLFRSARFRSMLTKDNVIWLEKNYRHSNETLDIMRQLRYGNISDELDERLRGLSPTLEAPTRLYTVNRDVDKENSMMLSQIESLAQVYYSIDKGDARYSSSTLFQQTLALKVDAQVMCLKNFPRLGVYNGTRGVVIEFKEVDNSKKLYPIVKFGDKTIPIVYADYEVRRNKERVFLRRQLPLKLCWAITIHKSQGLQFPELEIDLKGSERCAGQAYVALTRAFNIERIALKNYSRECFVINKEVMLFYDMLRAFINPTS
jgi:ATP-dependent DNA helicase PIF1